MCCLMPCRVQQCFCKCGGVHKWLLIIVSKPHALLEAKTLCSLWKIAKYLAILNKCHITFLWLGYVGFTFHKYKWQERSMQGHKSLHMTQNFKSVFLLKPSVVIEAEALCWHCIVLLKASCLPWAVLCRGNLLGELPKRFLQEIPN